MEKEVNIKHLFNETKKRIKLVLIISLVISIMFGIYYVFETKKDIEAQIYGAYGEIYIKDIRTSNEDVNLILNNLEDLTLETNNTSDTSQIAMSALLSDEVIKKVYAYDDLKQYISSADELRKMIYLETSKKGSIVSVYTVGSNQEYCKLVCDKVLSYGEGYLRKLGYDVEILRSASNLGTISIDSKESTKNEGKTIYIIKPISSTQINMVGVIKNMVIGFIIGIIVTIIIICARFIIRDRIVYVEQIYKIDGYSAIDGIRCSDLCGELMSSIIINDQETKVINFISIKYSQETRRIVEELASKLYFLNKKVLLMEYCSEQKECNSQAEYTYINKKYSDIDLTSEKADYDNNKMIYDYILVSTNDIYSNPTGKISLTMSDKAYVIIPTGSVTVNELKSFYKTLTDVGIKNTTTILV